MHVCMYDKKVTHYGYTIFKDDVKFWWSNFGRGPSLSQMSFLGPVVFAIINVYLLIFNTFSDVAMVSLFLAPLRSWFFCFSMYHIS